MYKLEIYHSGATQTYDASVIEDFDYSLSEGISEGVIEISDIEVLIDGDFLGATNIFELPEDDGAGNTSWRARLLYGETGTETEVFSGVVRRTGITNREWIETWSVIIQDASLDEFLEKIESVRFLAADGEYTNLNATLIGNLPADHKWVALRRDDNLDGYFDTWYVPEKLWQGVITTAGGITFAYGYANYFQYTITYLDTGFPKNFTRNPDKLGISAMAGEITGGASPYTIEPSLPDWSGKDLFEAFQAILGWTARASYDAYPSRNITVNIIKDIWTQPSNPPDFTDEYEEGGDPEVWIEESENKDIGMTFGNPYIESDVLFPEGYEYAGSLPAGSEVHVAPARKAVYYAATPKFDGKGEPNNDMLVTAPFRAPHLNDISTKLDEQPDPTNHPNYTEDVTWADIWSAPEGSRGEAFLAAFTLSPSGDTKLMNSRIMNQPHQMEVFNEIWPLILIQNYDRSTKEKHVMAVTVDLADNAINSFKVGDPEQGVLVGTRDWMVRRKSITYATESIVLELERPTDQAEFS